MDWVCLMIEGVRLRGSKKFWLGYLKRTPHLRRLDVKVRKTTPHQIPIQFNFVDSTEMSQNVMQRRAAVNTTQKIPF
jgi:hypothetical protein